MIFNLRSFVYLPIIFLLLLPVGFFVCYAVALNFGHVNPLPFWPYVSDTGALPPESSIFTLILTWAAFVALLSMFAHYKYVLHHGHSTQLNTAALIVGFLSCFGMTLVGSFQWTSGLIVHLVGAFMAFIGGLVYSWMIVYISWKYMSQSGYGKGIIYFRLGIAIMESVSFVLLLVSIGLRAMDRQKFLNFSTISEWFLIYGALLFLVSLIYEMNNIRAIRTRLLLHSVFLVEELEPNRFLLNGSEINS